jgi:hypothetical protein
MYNTVNKHLNYEHDQLIRALINRWKAYCRLEVGTLDYQEKTHAQERRIKELEEKCAALASECERLRNGNAADAEIGYPGESASKPEAASAAGQPGPLPQCTNGSSQQDALNIEYAFPVAHPHLVVGGWLPAGRSRLEHVALAHGSAKALPAPFQVRYGLRGDSEEVPEGQPLTPFCSVGFNLLIDTSGVELPAVLVLRVEGGASYSIDLEPHLSVKVAADTRRRVLRMFDPSRPAAVA